MTAKGSWQFLGLSVDKLTHVIFFAYASLEDSIRMKRSRAMTRTNPQTDIADNLIEQL